MLRQEDVNGVMRVFNVKPSESCRVWISIEPVIKPAAKVVGEFMKVREKGWEEREMEERREAMISVATKKLDS